MDGKEALQKLMDGNVRYRQAEKTQIHVAGDRRSALVKYGQAPHSVVIACSDSRVIPEAIFDADLGELFVVRDAGNVLGPQELGSIEYAVSHLGSSCILVLGHDHCGAIEATLEGAAAGFVAALTADIREAIGLEKDPEQASRKNVARQVRKLLDAAEALHAEGREVYVTGGLYHQISGEVEILEQHVL